MSFLDAPVSPFVNISVTTPRRQQRFVQASVAFAQGWERYVSSGDVLLIRSFVEDADRFRLCVDNWPAVRSIELRVALSGLEVSIETMLVDRDGFGDVPIIFLSVYPFLEATHCKLPVSHLLRKSLQNWAEHELDEAMYVDTVRAWDPHR